jgi:V/A-type H+/Na+-transporting ATPase subunit F
MPTNESRQDSIAVIGRSEVVAPFRAAGLAVFPVEPTASAAKAEELVGAGFRVIFYTEDLYENLAAVVARYSREAVPCLVMLPMGAQQQGVARLREIVKRAVGADIFGRGEPAKGGR